MRPQSSHSRPSELLGRNNRDNGPVCSTPLPSSHPQRPGHRAVPLGTQQDSSMALPRATSGSKLGHWWSLLSSCPSHRGPFPQWLFEVLAPAPAQQTGPRDAVHSVWTDRVALGGHPQDPAPTCARGPGTRPRARRRPPARAQDWRHAHMAGASSPRPRPAQHTHGACGRGHWSGWPPGLRPMPSPVQPPRARQTLARAPDKELPRARLKAEGSGAKAQSLPPSTQSVGRATAPLPQQTGSHSDEDTPRPMAPASHSLTPSGS